MLAQILTKDSNNPNGCFVKITNGWCLKVPFYT